MELEDGVAQLSVVAKKQPIDNFPLPQELRDEIYEYLLSSEAVADGTKYHLNTQLFSVNSTIKADAEKWLYHRHPFVLVSYKWARLDPALVAIVPKFSTNKEHIQKMKHYSMHIHLSCGISKQERWAITNYPDPELKWFLMFAEDLDVLAAVFDVALQPICGPTVLFGGPGHLTPRHPHELGSKAGVSFKLVSNKFRTMDSNLQRRLFDSLQGMLVGEGLKVTVIGDAVDPAEVSRLRHIMSPSVVFSDAKKWAADRAIRKLKWACDIDASNGHYDRAFASYKAMMPPLPLQGMTSPAALNFVSWPGVAATDKCHIADLISVYDCLVSAGWLALRTNNMRDFDHIVQAIIEHLNNNYGLGPKICWTTGVAASHLLVLYSIHRYPTLLPGLTNQDSIDRIVLNFPEPFWGPLVSHDIALLRKQDPTAPVTPKSLPLEESAARKLPLHTDIYDSYPPYDPVPTGIYDSRPPKRTMIGWQNADALEKLSQKDKSAINEMQKLHKFAVTDFQNVPDIRSFHDEMIATAQRQHGKDSFPVPLTAEQEASIQAKLDKEGVEVPELILRTF